MPGKIPGSRKLFGSGGRKKSKVKYAKNKPSRVQKLRAKGKKAAGKGQTARAQRLWSRAEKAKKKK